MEKDDKRIKYIDSLKGIACICIFLGHFYYGFYSSATQPVQIYPWIIAIHSLFRFCFNGTFCVCLFCFIAGYFSKECSTLQKVASNSFKRYTRLTIPILALGILTLIVHKTVTFDSGIFVANTLGNPWITYVGKDNNSNIVGVLTNSFIKMLLVKSTGFSSQLWMLRPLFFGQIAYYIFSYSQFMEKKIISRLIQTAVILFCLFWEYPCLASFLGGLVHQYRDKIETIKFCKPLIASFGITALLLGHFHLFSYLPEGTLFGHSLELNNKCQIFLMMVIMYAISSLESIKQFLSAEIFQKLGKISFSLYLLHILIMGSLSCFIFQQLYGKMSYAAVYLTCEIITIIAVLTLSQLWCSTIEKWYNQLIKKICFMEEQLIGKCDNFIKRRIP